MRRIGLVLEYVGTGYQGFQVQAGDLRGGAARAGRVVPTVRTVQGAVEGAILQITGAGRTDAGVHALGQVANFVTGSRIPGDRFAPALNTALPRDVRVLRSFEAPEGFNARYDAIAKVYRYVVVPRHAAAETEPGPGPGPGSAILLGRALLVQRPLYVQAMSEAARCLVGQHDFSAFASTGSSAKTSVRTIRRLEVQAARLGFLGLSAVTVEIEADGFLYKMVRTIVGALLEVGAGRADAGLAERLLASRDRSKGPATAPPDGLYLVRVIYPEPAASLISGSAELRC